MVAEKTAKDFRGLLFLLHPVYAAQLDGVVDGGYHSPPNFLGGNAFSLNNIRTRRSRVSPNRPAEK